MLFSKLARLPKSPGNFLRLQLSRNLAQSTPQLENKPRLRFYQWFATPRGQKIVGVSFVVGSVVVGVGYIAVHSILLPLVKDFYQQYTGGLPTKVSSRMLYLLNEVTRDLGMSQEEANRIKFFVMSLPEAMSWGDLGSSALIGYPLYFHYVSTDEVPIHKMYFGIQSTDKTSMLTPGQLQSPEARLFCESMILSDDAKKFAIAREVETLRMLPHIFYGALASCGLLGTLHLARFINRKLDLYRRPPLLRGLNYLSILPSLSLLYFTLKDGHRRYVEGQADSRAAALSPAYAAGGEEFYARTMQRNKALRVLHSNGQALYNLHGELVPGLLRLRTKPLQERLATCRAALAAQQGAS